MNSSSTMGYAESAPSLIEQYESITFEEVHAPVMHLFPASPARVADIGAGTGRDAAALARRGHHVLAVEPTEALRHAGRQIHEVASLEWLNDALPLLPALNARRVHFDLILLTAVWMHLDASERVLAMKTLSGLLAAGGRISMSLRHGPVPAGRRMFEVSAQETLALGASHGLTAVHSAQTGDMLGRPDVRWSFIVLQKN